MFSIGTTWNETEAVPIKKVGEGSRLKMSTNRHKNSNYSWLFGYQIEAKITVEFWESKVQAILRPTVKKIKLKIKKMKEESHDLHLCLTFFLLYIEEIEHFWLNNDSN